MSMTIFVYFNAHKDQQNGSNIISLLRIWFIEKVSFVVGILGKPVRDSIIAYCISHLLPAEQAFLLLFQIFRTPQPLFEE